jgi:cephalosporin-C deacetylase-like acetyl esterase
MTLTQRTDHAVRQLEKLRKALDACFDDGFSVRAIRDEVEMHLMTLKERDEKARKVFRDHGYGEIADDAEKFDVPVQAMAVLLREARAESRARA